MAAVPVWRCVAAIGYGGGAGHLRVGGRAAHLLLGWVCWVCRSPCCYPQCAVCCPALSGVLYIYSLSLIISRKTRHTTITPPGSIALGRSVTGSNLQGPSSSFLSHPFEQSLGCLWDRLRLIWAPKQGTQGTKRRSKLCPKGGPNQGPPKNMPNMVSKQYLPCFGHAGPSCSQGFNRRLIRNPK